MLTYSPRGGERIKLRIRGRACTGFMLRYFSNAAWPMQTREETNTEASLLITPLAGHDGWQKVTFSTRRGERANSRKCAFHALLISSASYTECALYLARANDGQTAGPSN